MGSWTAWGHTAAGTNGLSLCSRDSACLSVCPSMVLAFSRTPQGHREVAAAPGGREGWCLGGLGGWEAFAVQNGFPVISPGVQPAAGGLQLQVLVVAGSEEHVLPGGVLLCPCKGRKVSGLDNSVRH